MEMGVARDQPRGDFFTPHESLASLDGQRAIRSHGKARPLMLTIETVNICNNHCIVCAYDHQSRSKGRMAQPVFEAAVNQYCDIGGGFLSLTPVVGDVFLDRDLPERIALLSSLRDRITHLSVTTNASYASRYDTATAELVLNAFDTLHISVYGIDAEEFEVMTKTRDFDELVEGLDCILRVFRHDLSISFRCLKNRSPEELKSWVESLPSYAATSARVSFRSNVRTYANWGILDVSKPLPFAGKWAPLAHGAKAQCGIPLLSMQVFSNGNVSFCPCDDFDNVDELHLGNVTEITLRDMLNSEKAARLWDWTTHGTPEFCRRCSFHKPLKQILDHPDVFEDPLIFVGG